MGLSAYYVWRNVGRESGPPLVNWTRLPLQDRAHRFDTSRGIALDEPLPKITFVVDSLEGLAQRDSLWAGLPYVVFSHRLRDCLIRLGVTNIQFFEAELQARTTREINRDYCIANIVGLASCMDRDQSAYEPDPRLPGRARQITRLVIAPSQIPTDLRLFRLAELPSVILCWREVRDALAAQVTGIEFVEPELYRVGFQP